MMEKIELTISSIKRIRSKAILTLSSGEVVSMPRAMLKERPYRSGMPFDLSAFHTFIRERSFPFALEKAIRLLASRDRTEREIVYALRESAYSEETIARVMERLTEAGYINDAKFADSWAFSKASKGLGTRRIRMELQRKGISKDEIEDAIQQIDDDKLLNGAIRAAKKASHGKDISLPADRQKILAALARRGYEFSLAKKALDRLRTN